MRDFCGKQGICCRLAVLLLIVLAVGLSCFPVWFPSVERQLPKIPEDDAPAGCFGKYRNISQRVFSELGRPLVGLESEKHRFCDRLPRGMGFSSMFS